MPRTFAYARVSTTGQTTENQIQEIQAAGFHIEPRRLITETVSGSTPISRRRGFIKLMDRLESGDVLIVPSSTVSDAMPSTSAQLLRH